MNCEEIREQLGPYLDGELPADRRLTVGQHLASCAACRRELEDIRVLATKLASLADVSVPETLWPAVQHELDAQQDALPPTRARWSVALGRIPTALAASIALAIGLGMFTLFERDSRVQAAVDYGVLLDALPLNPHKAFRKFLVLYDAKLSTPQNAKRHAPKLNFEVPEELPGGFVIQDVYVLRFGQHAGVAAAYARGDEFLGTIFHRPVGAEDFGTHRDYPCVIGKHRGHKVEVGEWKLIHVTDPTTCHCVLTRLSDSSRELPLVLAAVAPEAQGHPHNHQH